MSNTPEITSENPSSKNQMLVKSDIKKRGQTVTENLSEYFCPPETSC